MQSQNFIVGNAQNLSTNSFEKNGFEFLGWNTDQNATTATYTNGVVINNENNISTTNGAVVNLYAIWKLRLSASNIMASPTTYYGKTINYLAKNGISDWKIFYADSNNIFIITSDYLPIGKVPTDKAKMTTSGTYKAYWASAPSTQNVSNDLSSSFMYSHWTNYSLHNNGKCVSTLLNTSNWEDFLVTDVADYSIGSPTIEMYCESWNAKYSSDPIYWNTSPSNSNGYYLATTENSTSNYWVRMSSSAGYNDTLYYPHKEMIEGCPAYWLASPSADKGLNDEYYGNYLFYVSNTSIIRGFSYGEGSLYALRPLVRLKSGVTLTENTENEEFFFDINKP